LVAYRRQVDVERTAIGRRITRLEFGYAFNIDFDDDTSFIIAGDFSFTSDDHRSNADASEIGPEDGALLGLLHQIVADVQVSDGSVLTLTTEAGHVLSCAPSALGKYEAWEIVNRAGARLVCTPHGDLARWS
jgi:hypothetical protein